MTAGEAAPASYRDAGVDIAAGEEAVARIRAAVASTARPEVLGGIGGFAGVFALDPARWREPVLVAATDGIGTKLQVALACGRCDTVGVDLVAMCVDDLVCVGAEPLFLLDYIATGKLDPTRVEEIVGGIAAGCREARCALLGGEMAEHPGVMLPGDLDVAGFAVGVVERSQMLGPSLVRPGDVLLGLASPGLRSNGYSLARHVLLERAGLPLDGPAWSGAAHSLADELLLPSVIYAPALLSLRSALEPGALHAAAHVTGGGLAGNLVRAIPDGTVAQVRGGSWPVPRVFGEIQHLGDVPDEEMAAVFNMGIGMVLVVDPAGCDQAVGALGASEVEAVVIGEVRRHPGGPDAPGGVEIEGLV